MCVKLFISEFNFALEKCNQFCKQTRRKFQSYRGSGTYGTLIIFS